MATKKHYIQIGNSDALIRTYEKSVSPDVKDGQQCDMKEISSEVEILYPLKADNFIRIVINKKDLEKIIQKMGEIDEAPTYKGQYNEELPF